MWRSLLLIFSLLFVFETKTPALAQTTYANNFITWKKVTQEYTPPPEFQAWWNEVYNCAEYQHKLSGTMSQWTFNVVDADAFTVVDEGPKAFFTEYTLARLRSIYIIKKYIFDPKRIKHEMLHAILAGSGLPYKHTDPDAEALFRKCSLNFSYTVGDSSGNYAYPNRNF